MAYPYPALWNACVASGLASSNYVTPTEWASIVSYATKYHQGKGNVPRYVNKALKRAATGDWTGSTLTPLKTRLTACVEPKKAAEAQRREERVAQVAREAAQKKEMEITKLRQELAATQQQLSVANVKFQQTKDTLNTVQEEITSLNATLEKERVAKEALEKKVKELAESLRQAKGDTAAIAKRFADAWEQVSEKTKRLDEMLSSLMEAQHTINNLVLLQQDHQRTIEELRQTQANTNHLLVTILDAAHGNH